MGAVCYDAGTRGDRMTRCASQAAWFVFVGSLLGACTITRDVRPLPPATPLSPLCIEENDTVWSKEFLSMLRQEFARRGIQTSIYQGARPVECRYHLAYIANWSWDIAVYLVYANLRIYDADDLIGEVTYDARGGSGRFDKLGTTEGKLVPLIDELMKLNPAPARGGP